MPDRRDKFISLFAALVLLGFLAVFALLNFRCLPVFCDGDIYTDMSLSRLMWEQKTLFPEGWIFGNQVYVIATPVWAALLPRRRMRSIRFHRSGPTMSRKSPLPMRLTRVS